VLDALYDAPGIHLITCRQESGAAFMAEAYGKLTGKPGVLLVTAAGPSLAASPARSVARFASTPDRRPFCERS
jgi:acetolactate synthase-1/2/3 large subunit